uniref:Uncharacterized protein n=1 Tax=Kalanchoe fedtschenkoi TaxID=63787 RepID=A0A7N0RIG3_KALFE
MESKRSHQWFIDNSEADLFPQKKQAAEVQSSPSLLGIPNSNVAQWENSSNFHSVTSQFTERLFDADSARTIDFDDRHTSSTGSGNLNVGRKNTDNPFGNDSSFGLSISHTVDDSKSFSQVKDSDNALPMSVGQAYMNGAAHAISVAQAYRKPDVNSIPTSLPFDKSHGNIISTVNMFHQGNNNFISRVQPFSKHSGISLHQDYRPNEVSISTDMSIFQTYSKGQDTGISNYSSDKNSVLRDHPYSKENESQMQLGRAVTNSYKEEDNMRMANLYNHGDNNAISFGKYEDEDEAKAVGKIKCNYNLLMGQPPGEKPAAVNHDESAKHPAASARQVITAYEFERHAENGKTIYGIVQVLRSTPQNLLFDVIQTITGSPIDQKSLCLWKESFLAATRELQRIYGRDEVNRLLEGACPNAVVLRCFVYVSQ